jgi:hypothetical protein
MNPSRVKSKALLPSPSVRTTLPSVVRWTIRPEFWLGATFAIGTIGFCFLHDVIGAFVSFVFCSGAGADVFSISGAGCVVARGASVRVGSGCVCAARCGAEHALANAIRQIKWIRDNFLFIDLDDRC